MGNSTTGAAARSNVINAPVPEQCMYYIKIGTFKLYQKHKLYKPHTDYNDHAQEKENYILLAKLQTY